MSQEKVIYKTPSDLIGRLALFMKDEGCTSHQVSAIAGLPQTTVFQWLNEKTGVAMPRAENLALLIKFFRRFIPEEYPPETEVVLVYARIPPAS